MCESKVQAWVKPRASAFCVSSTTRQAGGSVCKVTPKSMLPPSILPGTRDRGCRAQSYIDPAGEVPLPASEARTPTLPPQPVSGRTAEQRVAAVGTQPDGDERGAEHHYLLPGRAPRRVHELGQERQEEERGLRVEHVGEHALQEDAREASRLECYGDFLFFSGEEEPKRRRIR